MIELGGLRGCIPNGFWQAEGRDIVKGRSRRDCFAVKSVERSQDHGIFDRLDAKLVLVRALLACDRGVLFLVKRHLLFIDAFLSTRLGNCIIPLGVATRACVTAASTASERVSNITSVPASCMT